LFLILILIIYILYLSIRKLELHPNNDHNDEDDSNKFVSLYLRSEDVNNDLTNICTQAIYYIKNYKNFSYIHYESNYYINF